jgi:glycosyltransferase involved in cell wall biosynthesis
VPAGRTLIGIENTRTPGLAGTRNSGITSAKGELIAFCDDDDEWLPEKLSAQVELLQASPEHSVVTSGIIVVIDGKSHEKVLAERQITHQMLLRSRIREAHSSTLLIRRSALEGTVGMIDEELPGSYAEDYEFLLRASAEAPILVARSALVRVDVHAKSYFAEQWQTIAAATRYLLDRHPDLRTEKPGLARLYGRLAIAEAAMGNRRAALGLCGRSIRLQWRQHRAYTGAAIALHLLTANRAVRLAKLAGKGI